MSRLVVVGKQGYIASALCRWLDSRGVAFTAISSSECDLTKSDHAFRRFARFGSEDLQVIFTVAINPWQDSGRPAYEKNVCIAENFVAATAGVAVRQVIYLSSVDVYGSKPALPITEQTPTRPDTWYGRGKRAAEELFRECESRGTQVSILRLPGIYGPGAGDRSVIGRLVGSILEKGEVALEGNGNARRDFVFTDDLSRVIGRLLDLRLAGTWNVATGVSHSIRDMAALIARAGGMDLRALNRPPKPGRQFDLVFDNSKLRRLLPDLQFTSLHSGIQAYLAVSRTEQGCAMA